MPELVELWHSTYGDDAVLDLTDIEQYLGELGTAGRFDLTNAIDKGDVGRSLETLHRLMSATSAAQPKALHPMQIMASLSYHYQRLLRLDDPAVVTKEHAAQVLGMKSAGGARFPLEASKRLGSDGLREATRLAGERGARPARRERARRANGDGSARGAPGGAEPEVGASTQPVSYEEVLAARFMRRDVRRAAAFLWMTPLAPALSMRFCAMRTCSSRVVVAGGHGLVRVLHARLQLRAHALVADAPLLVLTVALLLRLNVGHSGDELQDCSRTGRG